MDDVDLLVRPEQAEEAARALDENGFSLMRYDNRVLEPAGKHHLAGRISPHGALVELHRALPGKGVDLQPHLDELWADSRLQEFAGASVRIPSPPHLFVIACQHVIGNHGRSDPCLARHLVDLHVLGEEAAAPFAGRHSADASLALLRSAQRASPADPGLNAQDLFQPALSISDLRERFTLAGKLLGRRSYLHKILFPPEHMLRARYGPGWLPWLRLRRVASVAAPPSGRKF